ncbi:hypothetical protein FB451DRAFT_1164114 [Mycena latifolia]|nr:hypothetical protein FB451DRAFT_1164114 [Mycena latifolia]
MPVRAVRAVNARTATRTETEGGTASRRALRCVQACGRRKVDAMQTAAWQPRCSPSRGKHTTGHVRAVLMRSPQRRNAQHARPARKAASTDARGPARGLEYKNEGGEAVREFDARPARMARITHVRRQWLLLKGSYGGPGEGAPPIGPRFDRYQEKWKWRGLKPVLFNFPGKLVPHVSRLLAPQFSLGLARNRKTSLFVVDGDAGSSSSSCHQIEAAVFARHLDDQRPWFSSDALGTVKLKRDNL